MGKHPQKSSFCRISLLVKHGLPQATALRSKRSSECRKTRRKTQALPPLNGSDFHQFRLNDYSVESTLELQLFVCLLLAAFLILGCSLVHRENICHLSEQTPLGTAACTPSQASAVTPQCPTSRSHAGTHRHCTRARVTTLAGR